MPRTVGSNAPETRERILEAAIELFQERGFAGTSIRDLAERAGMTTAAMYYYFEGKDRILGALFSPCLQALKAIDAPAGDDRARHVLDQVIEVYSRRGPALRAVMNDQSAMQYVRAHTEFASVIGGLLRQLAPSDDPGDLLRAQCALGALQRGLASITDSGRSAELSPGVGHQVRAADRAVILAAALAALHSEPEG